MEDCKFKSSKNWETLTARLKVPKDERTKQKQQIMIDGNYTGALEELLDFWILNSDHPTWQKLISAVEFYERRTAESMRKKLGIISEGENIACITVLVHAHVSFSVFNTCLYIIIYIYDLTVEFLMKCICNIYT